AAFDRHPAVSHMVLVVPENDLEFCRGEIISTCSISTPIEITAGGLTRQASVYNGLIKASQTKTDQSLSMVMVHDGVRPFVSTELLDRLVETAQPDQGCIPVLPLTDTIKQMNGGGQVEKTLDRSRLFRAQTPQLFELNALIRAYDAASQAGFDATDDASIMEFAGERVNTVAGCHRNIKLTTPADLQLAAYFLDHPH
ncbi:MAG: 2-C-methyl-D-erythritol 4-phosphate cytidylyltransferase, partial [Desulfobacterales bacterium]|nr:2-C-methyl-D-erythritol 4-phosphate cytidylyltransferase [Desulfobacterales bacterium]